MGDILSQQEIDRLLSAMAAGEPAVEEVAEVENEGGNVKPYDFRTANKFYKDQMRTLGIIFNDFAAILGGRITGMLRTLCEAEVISIEEQSFGEFNNSLPSPTVIAIIDMPPLKGSLLIEITPTLAYAFISRIYGGEASYNSRSKALSEIDLAISKSILLEVISALKEAWAKIVDVNPMMSRIETSNQFTQIVDSYEPSAIVAFKVVLDNIDGMMSICIPHLAIQPITKKLMFSGGTMSGSAATAGELSKAELIEKELKTVPLTVSAEFNETHVTFGDILSLNVGDTLKLSHNINEFFTIKVESTPKFKGVGGLCGSNYVVQVAKIIKEGEGTHE